MFLMPAAASKSDGGWELPSGWAKGAKHLRHVLESWTIPAAVTTAVVVSAVLFIRWWLESRALSDRVTFELVPSDSFDPSSDAVSAFGKQLARLRPAVSLVPRRGLPLRVSVTAGADGVLHHRVTVPARAVSVLRSACPAGVELREPGADVEPTMAAWRAKRGLTPRPAASAGMHDPGDVADGTVTESDVNESDVDDGGVGDGVATGRGEVPRPSRRRWPLSRRAAAAAEGEPDPGPGSGVEAGEVEAPALHTVRAELVLSGHSSLPLTNPGLDPDPLTAFASAAAAIADGSGGQIEVHVDLLPITAAKARAMRHGRAPFGGRGPGSARSADAGGWSRRLGDPAWWGSWIEPARATEQARRGAWGKGSGGGGRATSRAAGMQGALEDRNRAKAVAAKQSSRDQKWLVQVLLRAHSEHPDVAKMQLRSLLAAFDQWSGDNYWVTAGVNLGPLQLSSADRCWRRRGFDRRVERGTFRPSRPGWVTTSEIGALLTPPTARCGASNVLRSIGAIPPAPRNLPVYTGIGDR
ncbi:MAG: hypothetical protein DLM61_15245, partial [Pseudonocardiales bacterium]